MIVDDDCAVSPEQQAAFERSASDLRHTRYLRTFTQFGEIYVTRLLTGELRLSRKRVAFEPHPLINVGVIQQTIEEAGPGLWARLEAGADTPEKRQALVRDVAARLPCGKCRGHFLRAIAERPPPYDDAEAFDRWQWDEHNRVNKRNWKPRFPWEKYLSQKKK